VAVIEIASPGNKHSKRAVKDFVSKVDELLLAGIHAVVVDLFPPTQRDPVAVGDPLFPMPLFLTADYYIDLPLEETYAATWTACPEPIRKLVLG